MLLKPILPIYLDKIEQNFASYVNTNELYIYLKIRISMYSTNECKVSVIPFGCVTILIIFSSKHSNDSAMMAAQDVPQFDLLLQIHITDP